MKSTVIIHDAGRPAEVQLTIPAADLRRTIASLKVCLMAAERATAPSQNEHLQLLNDLILALQTPAICDPEDA
jgi:hypothetical protein